ncbi:MAG: nicotinate-nucleotide adenylyltransferase [Syntrophomonas sp.]|uniref:nicotinate-nucleotide adenylyltransferase n=1 Tax=Syntrophomonas sp. TaxID=2053627 RepID=UPI00262F5210|nr:nicotinate-nucleotide adenylyltransferase [Syntrophomonas sp.]MDD2511025.1 nicotinate-nucleotide adenylyltransferase [Syntrophomonas sp.]MDD3879274.1 nicotinate-nucleotide adenylyltransferase [Syntrophomonas sp.]MDD4627517.1 nicotinate-nucleotide adenylyltransferase [Syntrophomonas sp.]
MAKIRSLGILGGTFDPIHYGHLIAAEYACHNYKLNKVLLIPAASPPHKELGQVLSAAHRYQMVEMAIKSNPRLEVSPVEVERRGLSYTVDTLAYFQGKYPEVEFFFIVGADSLFFMHSWKEPERLAELCRFIVVTRPGYKIQRSEPALSRLPDIIWDRMLQMEIPGLDISSSDIRQRVAAGKPIKYLLPPEVEEYIFKQGLYRGDKYAKR